MQASNTASNVSYYKLIKLCDLCVLCGEPMIQEYQLRILPEIAANEQQLKTYLSQEKGLNLRDVTSLRILKRSIDARQRTIFVNLKVRVYLNEMPTDDEYERTIYNKVEDKPQVIVVGAGPGGLFAALRLIELGLRPVVVERGKDVRERKKDLAQISREHRVDPESNYSFGEGGAGAYSDGKLYTRSKKRGNVDKILNVFCQHGASTAILVDAHPHIGTDKLPRVIENMRHTIIECGGEVHFETRMDALIIEKGEVKGIETQTGKTFLGPVILATGHSARDVYRWLAANKVPIEAKGIAVGVRLEHPAGLIDQIQYHNRNGRGKYLPAAEYSFVTQVEGRGVYSFCMCPGGYVVNASSEEGRLAVNGMSYHARAGENANSAIIVTVTPEDYGSEHPLAGMEFQRKLEERAFRAGGGKIPVQRLEDFCKNQISTSFGNVEPQMKGAYAFGDVRGIFPQVLAESIEEGMRQFEHKITGFSDGDTLLSGVESRTSSPVKIPRDENMESEIKGIFPCGEGAGFAGGITSAAMDGMKVAEAVLKKYNKIGS